MLLHGFLFVKFENRAMYLDLYYADVKYIRDLFKVNYKIISVSPKSRGISQSGKIFQKVLTNIIILDIILLEQLKLLT